MPKDRLAALKKARAEIGDADDDSDDIALLMIRGGFMEDFVEQIEAIRSIIDNIVADVNEVKKKHRKILSTPQNDEIYRAANRSGEPLTTASVDTHPVLHATIQHHRETTSDATEEAPISPGYTAANCSGEPPTTARVDNMHPVLHAMTQHDRATTSDVREETKSRDYTEVANRRESPTTVRAGST
ncbi:hypothetical protein ACOMHN_023283 [Nucella lapillus]